MSIRLILVALTATILLLRFADEAWLGEDAFITLRVVDNFTNGFGLRWNVDERVMVYTHPLWMLACSLVYAVTGEGQYTVVGLGLLLSIAAYLLMALRLRGDFRLLIGGLFLPWMLSPTIVGYATSGFETPLTLFTLAAFGSFYLRDDERAVDSGWLSLTAGLVCLNRPDTVLLCAPPLLWLTWRERERIDWGRFALGGVPLVGWAIFSVFYYGFLAPNTAQAKLRPEFPFARYLAEGFGYAVDLVHWDPVATALCVSGILVAVVSCKRAVARPADRLAGRSAALAVGAVLYGAYVVRIGGDFLSGRMWIPTILALQLVLLAALPSAIEEWKRSRTATLSLVTATLLAISLFYGLAASQPARGPYHARSLGRVELQRDLTWTVTDPAARLRRRGELMRRRAKASEGRLVQPVALIGFLGFAAGPEVTLIDTYGLGDAFLSRLPPDPERRWTWRIGHLVRMVPRGYLEARRTGASSALPPQLRDYYDKLSLIISGPLWSWERLRTIVAFNLGLYDPSIEQWLDQHDPS